MKPISLSSISIIGSVLLGVVALCMVLSSCRKDQIVVPTEYAILPEEPYNPNSLIRGMYVLNEANMGSNKSSIDYVDYKNGLYCRNIYAEKNPSIVKELGDVGNDIRTYGSKLYAVINCSHKVEVMDAYTSKRIGQIDIPNCRYIGFRGRYAYISSYVGPVKIDPQAPLGAIYKVDTATLRVVDKVTVGYQPEELVVETQYIYVANSGGYRAPNYDKTVSVIEIERFLQTKQIPVGINLHRLRRDKYRKLWVSSRGNYKGIPSNLYVMALNPNTQEMEVTDTLNIACSDMAIRGDSLYVIGVQYDEYTQSNTVTYGIIDVRTKKLVARNFITDGTETQIKVPYGIAIHPETGDIYVCDATNYVSSGTVSCYSPRGKLKWRVRAGDIPAHLCFLYKNPKQAPLYK